VHYEVDAASLNMGVGTETPQSPGYHLFRVSEFPKIVFDSKKPIFDEKGKVVAAEGQFTLLNVTLPLTVRVADFKCSVNPLNKKEMCVGNITAMVKRSDFGMVEYIPGISDEIKISVPVEAYKD
jgi:polyisoprenoid-binding protein YceI